MEIVRDVPREQVAGLQAELLAELRRTGHFGHQGIEEVYASDPCVYIVARVDGKAIGVATLSALFGNAELHKLFVSAEYRRMGVSRRLFAEALAFFEEHEYDDMFAEGISESGARFLQTMSAKFRCEPFANGWLFETRRRPSHK